MTLTHRLAQVGLAFTLSAVAGICVAQGATTPAKKELVQKVLVLQQGSFDALARTLTENPVAMAAQQAGAVLQNRVAPEQRDAVAKDIQAEFNKYGDEVGPIVRDRATKVAPTTVGPILEEKLSEDELKQVIAALESPGFRKFMALGPDMQRALGQKLVADLQPQIDPKIKALEQAIAKRLQAASPPAAAAPKAAASGAKK